jgi:LCP family protein required for cell wall assembly
VPIAGTGSSDRINTAYATGGPSRLVRTIQEGLGIQVNHYVEIDFVGFQSIVDTVGGVRLYVPAPVRDAFSGLDIPKAGCVTLDGDTGLAWVRSRHYQYFEAGKWVEDPTADLGRIQRQQDFIRRMMKKAVSSGLTNPLALNRIIGIGVANVTLDDSMSTKDIAKVARRFRSLDPDTVDMLTLPATGANVGGASVLRLNQTEAQPYIDRMNGLVPPEEGGELNVRPSDVRVRILNGNGGEGVASKTGTALQGVGFNVADRGDADNYKYRRTVIRHAPGQADKAELLRRHLKAGATIQEDRNLRTVDLTLIVGADYAGVTAAGSAPGGASTPDTTVPQQSPVPTPKGVPATEPAC